jgi:hypothetical protein
MIQRYPITGPNGARYRLDPDNLPQDVKDEAEAISKLYVDSVLRFLKNNPDATPGYWTLGILQTDRSPDCDNWATAVSRALKPRQWKYFDFHWGTYTNRLTQYQHQMNIVTPINYKLVGGLPDNISVILDPWPTNTPLTYPLQNDSTGHMPQELQY